MNYRRAQPIPSLVLKTNNTTDTNKIHRLYINQFQRNPNADLNQPMGYCNGGFRGGGGLNSMDPDRVRQILGKSTSQPISTSQTETAEKPQKPTKTTVPKTSNTARTKPTKTTKRQPRKTTKTTKTTKTITTITTTTTTTNNVNKTANKGSSIRRTTDLKRPLTKSGKPDKRFKNPEFCNKDGTRDKRCTQTIKR